MAMFFATHKSIGLEAGICKSQTGTTESSFCFAFARSVGKGIREMARAKTNRKSLSIRRFFSSYDAVVASRSPLTWSDERKKPKEGHSFFYLTNETYAAQTGFR